MKIYVVGSSKNKFLPLDNIREKFLIDQKHEGDNIDFLNPWYCELTGLYYLWRHVDDEIVGLEHYRRYFVNDKEHPLNEIEIKELLKKHDIILYKFQSKEHNYVLKWNTKRNRMKDFNKIFQIIKTFYGEECYNSMKHAFETEDYAYEGNMFIGKKKVMDEYFKFIFTVLDAFMKGQKHFNLKTELRICGYLAEYIFGPWCEYKKLKIKENDRLMYNRELTHFKHGRLDI